MYGRFRFRLLWRWTNSMMPSRTLDYLWHVFARRKRWGAEHAVGEYCQWIIDLPTWMRFGTCRIADCFFFFPALIPQEEMPPAAPVDKPLPVLAGKERRLCRWVLESSSQVALFENVGWMDLGSLGITSSPDKLFDLAASERFRKAMRAWLFFKKKRS